MARPGDTLRGGGKRLILRETASTTRGARLVLGEFVEIGIGEVPAHLHPRRTGRFTVVSGTLGLRVGGETRLLEADDFGDVPPDAAHTYWNAGAEELHHVVTLEPALDHERFFESVYGLAADGFTPERKTLRNLLLAAGLFAGHDNWLAGTPVALQKLVFPPLAALGRRLGLRVWKPGYASQSPEVILSPTSSA